MSQHSLVKSAKELTDEFRNQTGLPLVGPQVTTETRTRDLLFQYELDPASELWTFTASRTQASDYETDEGTRAAVDARFRAFLNDIAREVANGGEPPPAVLGG